MVEARFQSFDDLHTHTPVLARVVALRADRQQNECLPASEERLAWLTGFTGSAGAAIVLTERAAVFVDGRYAVQADSQIDKRMFALEHLIENPPPQWLAENLKSGARTRG